MLNKYSLLSQVNMSIPTFFQERVASIGMKVSLNSVLTKLLQALQSSAICFKSADIPVQDIHFRARRIRMSAPR